MDATWDEALDAAANGLKLGAAVALATGANTNEALGGLKTLMANVNGKVGRLGATLPCLEGVTAGAVTDVPEADLVIVAGVDPLETNRVLGYLAKRAKDNGASIAVVCDGQNTMAKFADIKLTSADAGKLAALVDKASKPVVLYGAQLSDQVVTALKGLSKAKFIGLEPGANGRGLAGLSIAPIELDGAKAQLMAAGREKVCTSCLPAKNGAFTVAVASYQSGALDQVDVLLPAPIWAERGDGHIINLEGKTLALSGAVAMPRGVRDEVDVLADLASRLWAAGAPSLQKG